MDLRTVLAFAAIYILWGSTYFAIRIAVETLPALFAAGIRFLTAGAILYLWGRSRHVAPSRRQWRNLWILGALMFLAAYSGLFWAEKTLPSGVASVLVATIPVWTFLLEVFFLKKARFRLGTALAVVIGLGGVIFIAIGQTATGGAISLLSCLAILGSEISWSVGTVTSKLMDLPDSKQISAGAQMMCGGILLLFCALLAGELTPPPHIDLRAALATVYLIIVGSILAFTAYVWLLARMSSTRVASYAYVNPVVALAIGAWLGNEHLSIQTIIGAAFIVASVSLILMGERPQAPVSSIDPRAR